MSNTEFLHLAVNMHTRTVVGLIDAAMRADTPQQRNERLALARDAVLDFKTEVMPAIVKALQTLEASTPA
jgi:hypothetical protein